MLAVKNLRALAMSLLSSANVSLTNMAPRAKPRALSVSLTHSFQRGVQLCRKHTPMSGNPNYFSCIRFGLQWILFLWVITLIFNSFCILEGFFVSLKWKKTNESDWTVIQVQNWIRRVCLENRFFLSKNRRRQTETKICFSSNVKENSFIYEHWDITVTWLHHIRQINKYDLKWK